jgi:EAL domain-containing protein (putative c-di-GMP-specific phosphodiesterase class I)
MNVETIAEFVENETILEKLREMGVDYAEGYGLSHPVLLILIASRSHSGRGSASRLRPVGRLPASRSPAATRLTQFTEKGGFKAPS